MTGARTPGVDYDPIAAGYDRRYAVRDMTGVAAALRGLAEAAGAEQATVLEVGCGTGRWLEELRPIAGRAVGLDLSPGMLRQAQGRLPGLGLTCGRAETLPFPRHAFDLIHCVNALHHFARPHAFLSEARRLLRPGGTLAVIGMDPHRGRDRWYPYDCFPGTREADRARFPSTESLAAWMQAAGFEAVVARPVERIVHDHVGREVLGDHFLHKHGTSQLSLLSDDAYAAGIRRIETAIAEAESRDAEAHFIVDITLWMVVANGMEAHAMTDAGIPARAELDPRYTWNAESVFESPSAWEAELAAVSQSLEVLKAHRGQLARGPQALADALDDIQSVMRRAGKVHAYALMAHYVDTADPAAARIFSSAVGLMGQAMGAAAFFDPELLAIGQATLRRWLDGEPRLAVLDRYLHDLFRKQAHVRSADVEELLGLLTDPFAGAENVATVLTGADFRFRPARAESGESVPVAQGTIDDLMARPDRELRRTAWESYADTYLGYKNTLAANLSTSIKQSIFRTRARGHRTTLEASLFEHNLPVDVFHNLVSTCRRHLPLWHRYWAVRRKALGVEALHPYDIWAPLTANRPAFSYEQAVDWIADGLAPMGAEYVNVVRRGCLEDRWVDVFPNRGKTDGAFSAGWPGTHPFILMSWDGTIFSLSTLAHELGHSLHSYLAWKHQPMLYTQYALFVAEVASNFHQAVVRSHLFQTRPDRDFQVSLIEEAMYNFHRYFFVMPTLAAFELEAHERMERGQGLTADDLNAMMADRFAEGYGGEMHVDRERVGITWATFGHLYTDYYVYQYATGIAGAHALAGRILNGVPGAADDYLSFLKAGASMYPLDALKMAGVDLTTPEPVEAAFDVLSGMVDRLEALTAGDRR